MNEAAIDGTILKCAIVLIHGVEAHGACLSYIREVCNVPVDLEGAKEESGFWQIDICAIESIVDTTVVDLLLLNVLVISLIGLVAQRLEAFACNFGAVFTQFTEGGEVAPEGARVAADKRGDDVAAVVGDTADFCAKSINDEGGAGEGTVNDPA